MSVTKLSLKQLLEILPEVGVQGVEIVEDDQDFDSKSFLESIDNTRGALLKPRWEKEAMDQLKKEADGKAFASLRGALKRNTDLTDADFAELKTYPQYAELVVNHVMNKKAPEESAFETKLNEVREAINKEWEEKYNPVLEEKNSLQNKFMEKQRLDAYNGKFKNLPLSEKLDRGLAVSDFDKFVSSQYDVKIEDGEPKYYEKGSEILALNGGKVIKTEDLAKDYFEPRNNWVTSMAEKSAVQELGKVANPQQPYVQPQQNPNLTYAEQLKAGTERFAQQNGIALPQVKQ